MMFRKQHKPIHISHLFEPHYTTNSMNQQYNPSLDADFGTPHVPAYAPKLMTSSSRKEIKRGEDFKED